MSEEYSKTNDEYQKTNLYLHDEHPDATFHLSHRKDKAAV